MKKIFHTQICACAKFAGCEKGMVIKMDEKNIGQAILKRFLGRIFLASITYLVGLVVVLFCCAAVGRGVVWYGNEPMYPLLHWISENKIAAVVLPFVVGIFAIFIYYFRKLLRYMEEILKATEKMQQESDLWIHLPKELTEVENQMNAIQNNIIRNRQAAKEAEQRKNDLVVYLAHDLKTPLTSIIGYLTLLQEESEISPKIRERYLEISLDKAERLEDLINEFFEITRFNLTTMELEKQSINLSRMLEQTIYEFGPMLSEKSLSCQLNAPGDIMLNCDPDKMQRVFDNILRNGIIYGYEETEIKVNLSVHDKSLQLVFENQGPTIPAEKLERIFEQFYRLDSSRTSSTGGAGLGLAIAREIVRLHGGTMTAESVAQSTRFIVELPQS